MHLVLIHWKIRRTEQAVHDFLQYWSDVLTIPDRTGLIGEFLSQPLRPEETGLFQNGGGAAGHARVLFLCQSGALGGCARLPGTD